MGSKLKPIIMENHQVTKAARQGKEQRDNNIPENN